jgi:Asp-tRNA(Asn)/Glu-tRNA(Gln) amidotransferase A subunit family amidase
MSAAASPSPTGSRSLPGAAQLAREIKAGVTSATAALDACIERIQACDGQVNAVVQRRFERAREEAADADARLATVAPVGPLHGVPITVKDQYDVAGTPTTFGLASRRQQIASADGPLVQRLREAGAIILGKTNVPQVLLVAESDNAVFGRTNNPWDISRTAGAVRAGRPPPSPTEGVRSASAGTLEAASEARPRSAGCPG